MIYHSCFHIAREVVVGSGHTCCFRLIFVDVPRRRASDASRNYHVNLLRLQGHVLLASNILRAQSLFVFLCISFVLFGLSSFIAWN